MKEEVRMNIQPTSISGCYEINPTVYRDERGSFIKTYHQDVFTDNRLATNFAEEYYSISRKGVLRGLHFQTPPKDHIKLVYCTMGQVLDVVVDLRKGSSTYGHFEMFDLSAEKANMIYIPKGLAHGFYVLSEQAILIYKVTTTYCSQHDSGILWNSVGISWPIKNPIMSARDTSFEPLDAFISPFRLEE